MLTLIATALLMAPPSRADVVETLETARTRTIQRLEMQAEQAKASIRTLPKDRNRKKRLYELKSEIQNAEKQIADLKGGGLPPLPDFKFSEAKVGSFGQLDMDANVQWLRVIEVVNETSFIATFGYQEKRIKQSAARRGVVSFDRINHEGETMYVIRGEPTKDLVDGKMLTVTGAFLVADKVKYRGIDMFVIERFDVMQFLADTDPEK